MLILSHFMEFPVNTELYIYFFPIHYTYLQHFLKRTYGIAS